MKEKPFRDLVNKMRTAQEDYLANRISSNLINARKLEVQVDDELRKGPDPEPTLIVTPETVETETSKGEL